MSVGTRSRPRPFTPPYPGTNCARRPASRDPARHQRADLHFLSALTLHEWATSTIADGVVGDGAATNAVSIAEVCVGDEQPELAAGRVRSWGVQIVDLPAGVAEGCAAAYRRYRDRRGQQPGTTAPLVPLPDFFIGAHAQLAGWPLATGDPDRIRTYFPTSFS